MPAGPSHSPRRLFVDTGFLIASVNRDDVHHRKARELYRQFRGFPTLTTDAVLLEVGNSLAREFRSEATALIKGYLTSSENEVVRLTPAWFDRSLNLYESHADKTWGLVDCFSFVLMRERGLQRALTFDQHFVQAGFQALMR